MKQDNRPRKSDRRMAFSREDALGLTIFERTLYDALAKRGDHFTTSRDLALDVLGIAAGDEFGETDMRRHIANIREKLGFEAIETRFGHGYRLGEVRVLARVGNAS